MILFLFLVDHIVYWSFNHGLMCTNLSDLSQTCFAVAIVLKVECSVPEAWSLT